MVWGGNQVTYFVQWDHVVSSERAPGRQTPLASRALWWQRRNSTVKRKEKKKRKLAVKPPRNRARDISLTYKVVSSSM